MKNSGKTIFKVSFINEDSVYEIYARQVCESMLVGFIEVEEFVFGNNSSLLVDPAEERLKSEFKDVKRTYIPMHTILRIDEVNKEGVGKVVESKSNGNNISQFPGVKLSKSDDIK